jgi:hypothetical protein
VRGGLFAFVARRLKAHVDDDAEECPLTHACEAIVDICYRSQEVTPWPRVTRVRHSITAVGNEKDEHKITLGFRLQQMIIQRVCEP